jgi:phytoene/squalene synthetase
MEKKRCALCLLYSCTRRFERVVGQYSDKNNMPYNILITS